MKHILVVNPAAGRTNAVPRIRSEVEPLRAAYDIEIYETRGKGDATEFVKRTIASHPGEAIRFYSCGGDGTLKEVANGAVGAENVSVTCYPCGSGNDFVKYYGGVEMFSSLSDLFEAEERTIDLLTDGVEYSINAGNFGFDYAVCETMEKVRRYPLLGGKRAYYAGIAKALFTGMKNRARVYVDGERLVEDEKFLLCTIANGTYIGGSYMCAPRSSNEDGLLELCYVKPVSVFKFLKLIGYYKRGEHLDNAVLAPYVVYRRCRCVEVESDSKHFGYGLDGELHPSKRFSLKIAPAALRFAIPKRAAEFIAKREEKRAETAKCKQ